MDGSNSNTCVSYRHRVWGYCCSCCCCSCWCWGCRFHRCSDHILNRLWSGCCYTASAGGGSSMQALSRQASGGKCLWWFEMLLWWWLLKGCWRCGRKGSFCNLLIFVHRCYRLIQSVADSGVVGGWWVQGGLSACIWLQTVIILACTRVGLCDDIWSAIRV